MYNKERSQAHDPAKELVGDATDDEDDEDKRTIFCANIDHRVTEEILFEVFLQAGPVQSVKIPKENGGRQKSFGFITYVHQCSVPFALKLLSGLSLFKKLLTIKARQSKAHPGDVEPLLQRPGVSGASEFIPMRAEKLPYYNEVNPFKTDISPPKGLGWTAHRRSDDLKKHPSQSMRPHQNTPYSRVDNSRDHGGGGSHRNRLSGRRSRNR